MDNLRTPAAVFLQAALSPLCLITPSGWFRFSGRIIAIVSKLTLPLGVNHPYYGYTRSTFASQESMFARITSFPALGEYCSRWYRVTAVLMSTGHEFVVPHTQESVSNMLKS